MGMLEAHETLAGRTAIIVGGAHGVGRAVTLALARAGVHIATCDVDAESLDELAPHVEGLGVQYAPFKADGVDAPRRHLGAKVEVLIHH